MTWFRSTLGAGRLLTELATTAASLIVLRPAARLLRIVDDAHDSEPPHEETDA